MIHPRIMGSCGFILAFRCFARCFGRIACRFDRCASSIMESISNLTINVIFGTCTSSSGKMLLA